MSIERVVIGGDTFQIHQQLAEYGIDGIGNPHYLGEDYLADSIEVLRPYVTADGNIYYNHDGTDFAEDMFIAYCSVEIAEDMTPVSVKHKNGDLLDNSPQNLEFVY